MEIVLIITLSSAIGLVAGYMFGACIAWKKAEGILNAAEKIHRDFAAKMALVVAQLQQEIAAIGSSEGQKPEED